MRKSVDYMKHELFPNLIAHRRDPSHIIRLACSEDERLPPGGPFSLVCLRARQTSTTSIACHRRKFSGPRLRCGVCFLSHSFFAALACSRCVPLQSGQMTREENKIGNIQQTKNQHLLRKTRTPSLMTVSPFEVGIQSCFERRVWKSERG